MKKLFFLFLLALVTHRASAAFDVSGIQIGLPLATQKDAIANINPSYQLMYITNRTRQIIGIEGVARKNGLIVDQFTVIQDKSGIVRIVARVQALAKGERIKPDIFLNSLVQKYGDYSELGKSFNGTDVPQWRFDRQGNLYKGPPFKGPCLKINTSISFQTIGDTSASFIRVPTGVPSDCGTVIWTTGRQDLSDGMMSLFSVEIIDVKHLYDETEAMDSAEKIKKQQQLNEEKSKNIKPKL
jgi:hypothetical protein